MLTSDFDYHLPRELIAQAPLLRRDQSRMLVCNREGGGYRDAQFVDFPSYLRKEDVLVLNQTKVIPARLLGHKVDSGVPAELLLLRRLSLDRWEALVKPGRRLREGSQVSFGEGRLIATIGATLEASTREVTFRYEGLFEQVLEELGEMPLPPYILNKLSDPTRYQTVYARQEGSAAAPTAGLHFTQEMLDAIAAMGVDIVPILLHVGLGTFRPVKEAKVDAHRMHSEHYEVSEDAAQRINAARARGGRIVCVGTTSVRTLETLADAEGRIQAGSGETSIFIRPGTPIRAVDLLLTNFHLPQSTLLMLVSAFMGREQALAAYAHAVQERYRFFSLGDCMLIGSDLAG